MRLRFLIHWGAHKNKSGKDHLFSGIMPAAKKNGGLQLNEANSPGNCSKKTGKLY